MLFIDLHKLKIIKKFNFLNYECHIKLNKEDSMLKNKAIVKEACTKLCEEKPAIAACYRIELDVNDVTEEEFIGLVNLTTAVFFECFVKTGGRPRERRLDIPEKLTCAHISAGLLKRAVNTQTVTDIFNLVIDCGDFHYIMLDTKETGANE